MKKLILAIIAVTAAVSCSPLKIAMNQTGSDGSRYIVTTNQHLFSAGKGSIEIALGTKISGRDTILGFIITCDANVGHGVFNQGNKLMFRLADNSEISLTNLYDKEYEESEQTSVSNDYRQQYGWAYAYDPWTDGIYVTPYEVTRVIPHVNTYKVTNSYALYLVTKPQLKDLTSKGIRKIRVEIEDSDLDTQDTEGVSEMFKQMYDCLRSAVDTQVVRTEF